MREIAKRIKDTINRVFNREPIIHYEATFNDGTKKRFEAHSESGAIKYVQENFGDDLVIWGRIKK